MAKGKALEAAIKKTIEKQIGEQVWQILKDHIEEDIYKAYSPSGEWVWGTPQDSDEDGYQRRRKNGLLKESDKYIDVDHVPGSNSYRLRVSTTATPSESVLGNEWDSSIIGGFLAMLEKGNLGFWSRHNIGYRGVTHPFPRPVIKNAQAEAEENMGKFTREIIAAVNKVNKSGRK